ncbi:MULTISPECIES: conjugation system SOS inhibitor PsiB [Citrobacter]|uniref:conjugation system SOS inhibitor PsiB n=1 Tax=Citrobacter TaxID=544 RepID=UPI0010794860|nr:conjugation system SOS inhibitor PsiB [Citrobacter youngae]EAB3051345.1 hypothetical protein [Salmonella enterica]EIO2645139.1 conjugation system SOS inhibitor PsiB [Salmonella enterica]MBU3800085.1 conjugation system SOS inhibitor PsiB [Citrobacter youngae]
MMRNIITPAVLNTMIPQEFEDWRDGGEDLRRELTHAVMRDLTCPTGWDLNGEYRSEFGGFFPVQIRFTPAHGNFSLVAHLDADGYSQASIISVLAMEGAA